MKILIIGGTGTISTEVVKLLAKNDNNEVYVLNRGKTDVSLPKNVKRIVANAFDENSLSNALSNLEFDCACTFVAMELSQLKPSCDVLIGKVKQFIFISSASIYQKPIQNPIITEETALENPYWQYSRNKIECENYLMDLYKNHNFSVTIVRPSHTYCEKSVPMGMHGDHGTWAILNRMIENKTIIIHGDGTSLWTMTDSRDFAKAFVALIGNDKAIGEVFHITSDEVLTWNQIYQNIAEALSTVLNREIKLNVHHVTTDKIIEEGKKFGYDFEGSLLGDKANSVVFDNSKIKSFVSDFKATISHKEGTLRAVQYVLSHPNLQKEDPNFDLFCGHLSSI